MSRGERDGRWCKKWRWGARSKGVAIILGVREMGILGSPWRVWGVPSCCGPGTILGPGLQGPVFPHRMSKDHNSLRVEEKACSVSKSIKAPKWKNLLFFPRAAPGNNGGFVSQALPWLASWWGVGC